MKARLENPDLNKCLKLTNNLKNIFYPLNYNLVNGC